MTYGKWIWAAIIALVAFYLFNIFGFRDMVNGWFGGNTATPTEDTPAA